MTRKRERRQQRAEDINNTLINFNHAESGMKADMTMSEFIEYCEERGYVIEGGGIEIYSDHCKWGGLDDPYGEKEHSFFDALLQLAENHGFQQAREIYRDKPHNPELVVGKLSK